MAIYLIEVEAPKEETEKKNPVADDGEEIKTEQAAHTRVPNLIYDIVLPLVSTAERDCLHYIVRHTYGFADPNGGRKERDTISLDQFEHGIVSGNYLLDLGTQLSRGTIRKALEGLREKQLVEARYSCTNCFWEQQPGQSDPPVDKQTKTPGCPRCRASLSRSWALAPLTPRKLTSLLNKYDKQKRKWVWDRESQRFRFADPVADQARERAQQDVDDELRRLKDLLWYPELVDSAADKAGAKLKSGKVSPSRRLNNFYKPVYELQEEFNNPALIKYALEQTLSSDVFRGERTHTWHRYALRVAENSRWRFRQANDTAADTDTGADKQESLRQKELAMREVLGRTAQLNGTGETAQAREMLALILSQVKDLTPLFDGDADKCEHQLRLAFKQGSTDFVGVKPDEYALDYYPDWSPS